MDVQTFSVITKMVEDNIESNFKKNHCCKCNTNLLPSNYKPSHTQRVEVSTFEAVVLLEKSDIRVELRVISAPF